MPQHFSPAADRIVRRVALALLAAAVALAGFGLWRSESAAGSGVGRTVEQPIPFSHAQHVGKVGLDCAYCHTGASNAAGAGMPDNSTCLTCHAQLFRGVESLQPLHDAEAAGRRLRWNAVTRLSSVARFHHGAHARAGVSCVTCHGAVETMAKVQKVQPMSMPWCVECHRDVSRGDGRTGVHQRTPWRDLTDCSVCHY